MPMSDSPRPMWFRPSLIAMAAGVCLSGCAPRLADILPVPNPDPRRTDSVQFELFTPAVSVLDENTVLSPNANILPGSSFVIDVPVDLRLESSGPDGAGQGGFSTGDFSTRGYFNFAEQAIERGLLLNGFVVKDRSKFEAVLRDMRDREYFAQSAVDPAIQPILNDLRARLESGLISESEYANQVMEFRNRMQVFQQGPSNTNQLADASEIIRAAGASDIRAEYILQISNFETLDYRNEQVYLLSHPDFRDFVDRHAAARRKFNDGSADAHYACEVAQASLDAKLIHVASGDVVWIGHHTVTEIDAEDNQAALRLEVSYERDCANCDEVSDRIAFLNTEEMRRERARGEISPRVDSYRYVETVSDARRIGGSQCQYGEREDTEALQRTRRELASRVAGELIGTIRPQDILQSERVD